MIGPLAFSAGAHVLFVISVAMVLRMEFEVPRFLTAILTVGILFLELGLGMAVSLAGLAPIGVVTSYTSVGMFVGAVALGLLQ